MKIPLTIAILAVALGAIGATYYPPVVTDTNGYLRDTNLFTRNIGQLTNSLNSAGFAPGGGTGNADTNSPNAWSGKQTFNGDVLVGPTNLYDKLMLLDSGKANADSDLDALAGLALTGVVARTGAATYALRTLTGDTEIVVANGDGVAGGPSFSIGAAIARVAALANYQPVAAILSRLTGIGLGSAGDVMIRDAAGWTNLARSADGKVFKLVAGLPAWGDDSTGGNASTNATQAWAAANTQTFLGPVYFGTTNVVTELAGKQNADAQLDVVANLTSGTATNFLAGDGTFKQVTTNMVPGLVADILAAAAAGGGGDLTLAGTNLFTGQNTFGGATTISNLSVPGTMTVGSVSFGTPLGLANGGTGGTNAETARTALGLIVGSDVQGWDAHLQQLATVGWASGDVPWFDGSNLTNLVSTAAGRALLTAANAAAQWDAIKSDALQSGAYDAGTWDGVTGKAITPDQFRDVIANLPGGSNAVATVTPPLYLSNGVLTLDTDGLGGGGSGYTYLVTNADGAFQSRAAGTNWTIISTTVSSNYAPAAAGLFLEGGFGLVISNFSGTSANILMNIAANGTTVFRDAAGGLGTGSLRAVNNQFVLVRESDTTASFWSLGGWWGASTVGFGDFGGASQLGGGQLATNIAWNWATNNTLDIALQCETSTSTNDALGIRVAHSYLRAEGAASSGGTGDVVGPASSTDSVVALYDGVTGKLLKDGTLTESAINAHLTEAEASALYQKTNTVLTTLGTLNGGSLTNLNASSIASGTISSNRLPDAISLTTISAGTLTATSVAGDGSWLTNLSGSNIASGTVADARIDTAIARTNAPTLHSPTLLTPSLGVASATSLTLGATNLATALAEKAPLASPAFTGTPTVNGSVVFGQSDLAAHSDLTNFVVNPTVAPYQVINGILTNALPWVRILHATNVAAGRQTTVLFCAGTNASVNVFLNPQFARNTNSVTVTTGQILPISFYGYGPDNTNVIATMGTPYTR